ncbi:hypothetical protein EG68_06244 [Paragonimus skrjabini miyazakii]|uniref:Exonuclease domain-containing protein n=1 Tax=Paragonimus skrjabini miyazakii TaxID=59628 RepID=A0A8S9Y9Q6_9TREM|nr:hypothetical protein EG68_06244 [Paragonimus skrjabini miyazakii]
MFPTSGLFQEFLCPMFKDGHCNRPYCHFNHSKVESSTTDSVMPKVEISSSKPVLQSDVTPVYRPTPISILEKRDKDPVVERLPTESHVNGTCKPRSTSSSIPVYQPTPISELERYAPCSVPTYGLETTEANQQPFVRPSNPPTYSPVVPSKAVSTVAPPTPSYPTSFVYQPSPAYPPVMNDVESLSNDDHILTLTGIPNSCNDIKVSVNPVQQKIAPTISSSTAVDVGLSDKIAIFDKKKGKRKLKLSSVESTPTCPKQLSADAFQDSVQIIDRDNDHDVELEDLSNADLSKRQKLLTLYQDLYGEEPTAVKKQSSNLTVPKQKIMKATQRPLPPYTGSMLSKPTVSVPSGTDVKMPLTATEEVITIVPRPRVPLRKSDKIPMPIRTRYLDQFIEECLVIYECPNDAYNRALIDEQACHDKATSRMAYLNAVIQRLKCLKAEKTKVQADGMKIPRTPVTNESRRPVSSKSSETDIKSEPVKDTTEVAEEQLDEVVQGPLLYDQLRPYILTEEQLVDNSFPREDKSDRAPFGKAKLTIPDDKRSIYEACQTNERICARCSARFTVDEFGNALVVQKCIYHWGKPVRCRTFGLGVELRYFCCQAEVGQPGCQLCVEGHVHEANKWFDTEGFVATLPPLVPHRSDEMTTGEETAASDKPSTTSPVNVYALDCEMVYTTAGCELGRVTIVDCQLQPVLDSVVRPYGTIIDCNTRFSGLTREDLEQSDTRITDIQAKLLHLFDSDTILIGHSLESDLVALKLIHSKIVDTSIMFPHRFGPPKKRALRNLVCELLQRIIQQDDAGHNSLEDAVACMQLVQFRVKENLRRGKWVVK